MAEERNVAEDVPFVAQIKATKHENFLGNRETVDAVLRMAISEFVDGLSAGVGTIRDVMEPAAKRAAAILLGRRSEYVPMHQWNVPGHIDRFVAKWLGSSETDPDMAMEHGIVKMLGEVLGIVEYAGTPGVLTEQWDWQMDEVANRYTDIFMGIDPVSQMTMSFKKENENEPEAQEE